jgi:hypothetical protein
MSNLRHLDTEAIFKPFGDQVPMAKHYASVTISSAFPTQQYWMVAERDQPLVDLGWFEPIEDLAVKSEINGGLDRAKPGSGR